MATEDTVVIMVDLVAGIMAVVADSVVFRIVRAIMNGTTATTKLYAFARRDSIKTLLFLRRISNRQHVFIHDGATSN